MSSFNLTHPRWSYTTFIAELVLRVFHVWGQYCLHLAFSACLRTNGASNGIRTRILCMASRDTNHYTIPAYRCKKIMQPSYGHHPRVSGSLLTNISSLCSKNIGAGNRSRTCNLLITNQLRCQLRHTGINV